jgi:pyocin large subunit-like protein
MRQRRRWQPDAVTAVARITGLARSTIGRELAERRAIGFAGMGGGRKSPAVTDATLLADLKDLVEPTTRGDPMAPLLLRVEHAERRAGVQ